MKPIIWGVAAAFFFASTFVMNRMMDLSGGSWIWSASLRYLFMIPLLLILVLWRGTIRPLFTEMKRAPGRWLLWSTIGFGLFYAPLCYSAAYGPGWLMAGTWQITIISGSLLAPIFLETIQTSKGPVQVRGRIPMKGMAMSLIILLGVVLIQLEQAEELSAGELWAGVLPVIMASFAYPLGNRKMMQLCGGRLDAYQRVLGMTLASLPFWLVLSLYGLGTVGVPSKSQLAQSVMVALCSGVIATVVFFRATDMVRNDIPKLAAVEATQSMEVLFAAAGELLLLQSPLPSAMSWAGMFIVMLGMILHSMISHRPVKTPRPKKAAVEINA